MFLIFIILAPFYSMSQTEFNKALGSISSNFAEKLKANNMTKLAVLYINSNVDNTQTAIGKYMADAVSVNMINSSGNFRVFDRDNINAISGLKKLISEGYIDPIKAKQIGQLLSVEVIIIGTYAVLSNSIRLNLKALDVNDGFSIAASAQDLPLDADTRVLLYSGNVANGDNISNNNGDGNNGIVTNTPFASCNGSLKILNRGSGSLQIIVSTEKVDLVNSSKSRYEIISVSGNSSEVDPELTPGVYYVCLIGSNPNGWGDAVLESKKIVIEECKQAQVVFTASAQRPTQPSTISPTRGIWRTQ